MVSDKIRIILIKRKVTFSELAEMIETTPQNLSNKMRRNNFNEREMLAISQALGCKLSINFIIDETGERI